MSTALAKDPDDRYQSGRELVEAARAALGLEPKRTRWPQALAGVGLLLLGAALLAFFLTRGNGGAGAEPGADSLVRIDPKTNTVARTMPVGRQTSGVAVSGRRVWVANAGDGTLWRIDPGTSKVLKIPVHATPTGVAAAGPYVVVANGPEGTATGFDAATGENLGAATLSLPDFQTILVAGGEGRIWYAVPAKQMAGDAAGDILPTATPSGDVHIPPDETDLLSAYTSFDGLAVGEGSIWLAGDAFGRTVWRVDPGSRQVIATIPLPFIPAGIAAGENGVWITSLLDDTVSRLDPRTGRITWTVRVGRGGYAVSAGEGGVWVASSIDGTVTRLDPGTGRVVAVIPTRRSPTAVAAGAGGVWVVEGT